MRVSGRVSSRPAKGNERETVCSQKGGAAWGPVSGEAAARSAPATTGSIRARHVRPMVGAAVASRDAEVCVRHAAAGTGCLARCGRKAWY